MIFVDIFHDPVLWWNGEFLAASKAVISHFDSGFQYGDGLFETIRVDHANIHWLDDHLLRLMESCTALDISLPTNDWQHIIFRLIEQNRICDSTARVKILVTRGIGRSVDLSPTENPSVLITAEGYLPPTEEQYNNGWTCCLSQSLTTTVASRFKSLSYLPSLMARREARVRGCDEILFTDSDGDIAEGSMTSLLLQDGNRWLTPDTPMQLPGIARRKLIELMSADGITVRETSIHREDVRSAETVWLCNSMIGIMPVCSVEGRSLQMMRSTDAASFRRRLLPA